MASVLVKILLANAMGHSTALLEASFLRSCIPSLACRKLVPRLSPNASVSMESYCFHCRMSWLYSSWWCFCPCHLNCDMCCSGSICILLMSASTVVYKLLQLMAKIFPDSSLYQKMIVIPFIIKWGYFGNYAQLLWVQLQSFGCQFPKEWYLGTPEMALFYFKFFSMAYLHYLSEGSVVIPAIRIIPYN